MRVAEMWFKNVRGPADTMFKPKHVSLARFLKTMGDRAKMPSKIHIHCPPLHFFPCTNDHDILQNVMFANV